MITLLDVQGGESALKTIMLAITLIALIEGRMGDSVVVIVKSFAHTSRKESHSRGESYTNTKKH